MKSVSLIIPTFNDEKTIEKKVFIILKKLEKKQIKFEIVIINDGSTDGTLRKLKKIKLENNCVKLIDNKINLGKSYSVRKALKITKYNNIIISDSDLPYLEVFDKVLFQLSKNYDFVFVNRRHSKSKLKNTNLNFYQLSRYFLGNLVGLIFKVLLNLNIDGGDTQAGLKGFKKIKQFNKLKFVSKKFFLDLEIMYYYKKYNKKFFSVPVKYTVPVSSTIKIFSLKKNLVIFFELFKVIQNLKK
jgi:glycosyltransferase involved in cell wall biosynthesis